MPTLIADTQVARAILAANRPVRSAGAPARAERMVRHATLDVWFDPQHAFLVVAGCRAIRAITDQARFCWLVRQDDESDGLSYVKNPYDIVPPRSDDDGMRVPYPAVTELAASLHRDDQPAPLAERNFRGRGLHMPSLHAMTDWVADLLDSPGCAVNQT